MIQLGLFDPPEKLSHRYEALRFHEREALMRQIRELYRRKHRYGRVDHEAFAVHETVDLSTYVDRRERRNPCSSS